MIQAVVDKAQGAYDPAFCDEEDGDGQRAAARSKTSTGRGPRATTTAGHTVYSEASNRRRDHRRAWQPHPDGPAARRASGGAEQAGLERSRPGNPRMPLVDDPDQPAGCVRGSGTRHSTTAAMLLSPCETR